MNTILYERCPFDLADANAGPDFDWPIYVPSHFHNHIEMIYMKTGTAAAAVDLVDYVLEPDDLLIVFPNQIHRYTKNMPEGQDDHTFDVLLVDPHFIPDFADLYKGKSPECAIIKGLSNYPSLYAMVTLLSKMQKNTDSASPVILKGLLYSILGEFALLNPLVDQPASEKSAVKTIIKYCSENYGKDISLELLEQDLFLSKYYISHVFHDKMKTGFFEYVNFLRVSEACQLLLNTDMSIAKIGEAVGFKSTRTFNRAFSRIHGVSPLKYKESKIQGSNKK